MDSRSSRSISESTLIRSEQRAYEPRGGALELLYCQEPEVLIEGPAGTGKSRGALEKVNLCAMKYPGMRALIARKTRQSMTESVLVTFENKVLPAYSPIASNATRRVRQSYSYPNGSEIVCGGLDNPDRIMSTEYDMIYVPEATEATEHDVESLTTRLRNGVMPYQQIILDCNPAAPTHWLNQRCVAGKTRRILSRHTDNPSVTESYLQTLRALSGARRARLCEGKWAAQEGLIYEFDPAVHVVPRFEIPMSWRRIRSIDFGYTNPLVCQWWAIDPDGRMYLYREIYMSRRTVAVHAPLILGYDSDASFEITVADHDAEDRATLAEMGLWTQPAHKAVSPGIQAVQERLKIQPDGKPRLFLMEDTLVERDTLLAETKRPTSTREEFDSYAWSAGADGRPQKEQPGKVDDHAMDALRYAVAYEDITHGFGFEAF